MLNPDSIICGDFDKVSSIKDYFEVTIYRIFDLGHILKIVLNISVLKNVKYHNSGILYIQLFLGQWET